MCKENKQTQDNKLKSLLPLMDLRYPSQYLGNLQVTFAAYSLCNTEERKKKFQNMIKEISSKISI